MEDQDAAVTDRSVLTLSDLRRLRSTLFRWPSHHFSLLLCPKSLADASYASSPSACTRESRRGPSCTQRIFESVLTCSPLRSSSFNRSIMFVPQALTPNFAGIILPRICQGLTGSVGNTMVGG